MKRMAVLLPLLVCSSLLAQGAAPRLLVHEWGTFTSLQDENGNAIGGINTDDEPLPQFTYNLVPSVLQNADVEGAPRCHPDVTMRLETPVIYFHPQGQWNAPVDVHVDFRGGWLTQFYPDAAHPDLPTGMKHLTEESTSSLTWRGMQLGGNGAGPATDAHVWTAPRAVDAALVTTASGEKERFLFYRGVGHLNSPVRAVRQGGKLTVGGQPGLDIPSPATISEIWLAEFRGGGKCAFRAVDPVTISKSNSAEGSVTVNGAFADADFTTEHLTELKQAMHAALMKNGLYDDEAWAVLNTWETSYFQSGGQRLFYMVPKEWVGSCLPLKISVESDVARVMVGRLEVISPRQRELLSNLATKPAIKDYMALGRFRSALLLHEYSENPTPEMKRFISENVQSVSLPSLRVAGKIGTPIKE